MEHPKERQVKLDCRCELFCSSCAIAYMKPLLLSMVNFVPPNGVVQILVFANFKMFITKKEQKQVVGMVICWLDSRLKEWR